MNSQPSNQPNHFSISWDNPALSSYLSPANILEYFCDLSNPFYDRECNNEVIRMQRLSPEQLLTLTGVEYYLHHFQEPNLYIIRKQLRRSANQVTPLAYYYVINGTVMQAPDLNRLCNARLHTTSHGLNKALKLLNEWAKFNTINSSYCWSNPNETLQNQENLEQINKAKVESNAASIYQLRRIDFLLSEWTKQFPNQNTLTQRSLTQNQVKLEAIRENPSKDNQPPNKKTKLE